MWTAKTGTLRCAHSPSRRPGNCAPPAQRVSHAAPGLAAGRARAARAHPPLAALCCPCARHSRTGRLLTAKLGQVTQRVPLGFGTSYCPNTRGIVSAILGWQPEVCLARSWGRRDGPRGGEYLKLVALASLPQRGSVGGRELKGAGGGGAHLPAAPAPLGGEGARSSCRGLLWAARGRSWEGPGCSPLTGQQPGGDSEDPRYQTGRAGVGVSGESSKMGMAPTLEAGS